MKPESNVTPQLQSESPSATVQPRKQWQTPRFEQHDVRQITRAKPQFNLVETSFAGPVS